MEDSVPPPDPPPERELQHDLVAASRRPGFGPLQMLGSLLLVGGLFALLAEERVAPGAPATPTSAPPARPRGAVFLGARGLPSQPQLLAWASVVQHEERRLALTLRGVFGAEGPPAPARIAAGGAGYFLLDLERREPIELQAAIALPRARAPQAGLDIEGDLAAYGLSEGALVEPLALSEEAAQVGQSVWLFQPNPQAPRLVLGEVAQVRAERLVIRVGVSDLEGVAGAPWLDAAGRLVALTGAATEQAAGVLVYALPANRIRGLLGPPPR